MNIQDQKKYFKTQILKNMEILEDMKGQCFHEFYPTIDKAIAEKCLIKEPDLFDLHFYYNFLNTRIDKLRGEQWKQG